MAQHRGAALQEPCASGECGTRSSLVTDMEELSPRFGPAPLTCHVISFSVRRLSTSLAGTLEQSYGRVASTSFSGRKQTIGFVARPVRSDDTLVSGEPPALASARSKIALGERSPMTEAGSLILTG